MEEGIQALEAATAHGWDTRRYRELGDAYRSSSNRERAIRAFASVAADPGTTAATADSLRHVVGVEPEAKGRRSGERRDGGAHPAGGARGAVAARVRDHAGRATHSLLDTLGDKATVIVVWSRYCGFSHQAMPGIAALGARLGEIGVPLVALTRNPPAEAEEYLRVPTAPVAAPG